MSTSKTSSWAECVLGAGWLNDALTDTLRYPAPLPVQNAVVPTVVKALMSGIPMDVSLTAPTGSGKTLCYLLPMLRFIAEEKRGLDNIRLRGLVLVPTKVLGQQVYREVQQLLRSTTITATHWCHTGNSSAQDELRQLLRRVRCPGNSRSAPGGSALTLRLSDLPEISANEGEEDPLNGGEETISSSVAFDEGEEEVGGAGEFSRDSAYFFKADILITTPQRLLQHLDRVDRHLRLLSSLKLLVMDEADQVLGGHFANAVTKVVERFETEKREERLMESRAASDTAGAAGSLLRRRSGWEGVSGAGERRVGEPVLHKILCSASLSSRIARISEVRLRNCVFYALKSDGKPLEGDSTPSASTSLLKRTAFAFPPTLQEHILFVEEHYRHAMLLKLVRTLLEKQQRLRQEENEKRGKEDDGEESDSEKEEEVNAAVKKTSEGKPQLPSFEAYPPVEPGVGERILIFCSSAEEARVVAHFLYAGGIPGVLEFTTAASESERRRALLMQRPTGSHSTAGSDQWNSGASPSSVSNIIVASDALMRGVDLPGVAHVIMYHPPETLAQLLHRAGRTARALRNGHVHLLLTKRSAASDDPSDDQVAKYFELCTNVSRTLPLRYERGFLTFRHPPKSSKAVVTPKPMPEESAESDRALLEERPFTSEEGEWWVQEADRCLERSQHQLQRSWGSVMDSVKQKQEQRQSATPSASAGLSVEEVNAVTATARSNVSGFQQSRTHQRSFERGGRRPSSQFGQSGSAASVFQAPENPRDARARQTEGRSSSHTNRRSGYLPQRKRERSR